MYVFCLCSVDLKNDMKRGARQRMWGFRVFDHQGDRQRETLALSASAPRRETCTERADVSAPWTETEEEEEESWGSQLKNALPHPCYHTTVLLNVPERDFLCRGMSDCMWFTFCTHPFLAFLTHNPLCGGRSVVKTVPQRQHGRRTAHWLASKLQTISFLL